MRNAIVLMGYGSPESREEIPEYLRDVYGGRDPPDYAVRETDAKYSAFSYKSPSTAILRSLEGKIRDSMRQENFDVFLSFKHWKPSLNQTASEISSGKYDAVYAIPLFPIQNSSVIESYVKPFTSYLSSFDFRGRTRFTNGFEGSINLLKYWSEACESFRRDGDFFLFTAHSLPHEVRAEREYYGNMLTMAAEICESAGIDHWSYAFQSRGSYGKKWLEPSVYRRLDEINGKNFSRIVTVPIGFIYDHLEVLYDLDTLFGGKVKELGLNYARVKLPNDSEQMVSVIREVIGGLEDE
ncbi:MAG: ferrochelatase [Candidatus Thermoplasmatota archaeon]|jgi:ferrochelatase|nr:ferrochelatase [Candidatus Thermoplasmatota archaeon]MCL5790693.1 ferrochelatase [Candidatus Thermoplasmatota archaeon]